MNALASMLNKYDIPNKVLTRDKITTLQVNVGNLCNQSCEHCHVAASPEGSKIMSREVMENIVNFLKKNKIKTLDITGGAPELNPNFKYFVRTVRPLVDELMTRSNLTVLIENEKKGFPEFFRENNVHLICSLPCHTKEKVDAQRGKGVFEKSIKALKLLNRQGYGVRESLKLDLVFNTLGARLPEEQETLKHKFQDKLGSRYGVSFDDLLTITNVPVNKFKDKLMSNNEYKEYFNLLKNNFNPDTLQSLMCKTLLSVGYDGTLYDCDFNLVQDKAIKDDGGKPMNIKNLGSEELTGKEVITGNYCLACTAGSGSSCQGSLK
ncbi:MAG: arsenosugar biosynthesis radical SAM (seleno)protein ArsS [Elusimicrobiota bacterium]